MPNKKLRITKEQAIKECKELWGLIVNGKYSSKQNFLDSTEGIAWISSHPHFVANCSLCDYVSQWKRLGDEEEADQNKCLEHCPLCTKLGDKKCYNLGYGLYANPERFYEAIKML
jgi:hypothetical protein